MFLYQKRCSKKHERLETHVQHIFGGDGPQFARHPTLPKTNIAPTNGWLEYYFPIGEAYFQGLC